MLNVSIKVGDYIKCYGTWKLVLPMQEQRQWYERTLIEYCALFGVNKEDVFYCEYVNDDLSFILPKKWCYPARGYYKRDRITEYKNK